MIAIDMPMPQTCEYCRFCGEDKLCHAGPRDETPICGYFGLSRPEECPLRPVERLSAERLYPHPDCVLCPEEELREYALRENAKKIAEHMMKRPGLCEVTYIYPAHDNDVVHDCALDDTRVRTDVNVVVMVGE